MPFLVRKVKMVKEDFPTLTILTTSDYLGRCPTLTNLTNLTAIV
jgi:hypothetical protein